MKNLVILIVFAGIFIPRATIAQTDSLKPGLILSDVYFNFGSTISGHQSIGLDQFQILAPRSVMLDRDFSDFSYRSSTDEIYSIFKMGLALSPGVQNEKYQMKLRFDLSYVTQTPFTFVLSKTSRSAFDTLYSVTTGEKITVDSVKESTYTLSHKAEQLELNGSFILSTNPYKRWSFYGGLGFFAAYTVYSQTSIEQTNLCYIEPYINYNQSTNNQNPAFAYDSESFSNKSGYAFGGYIPVGLNFRLSMDKRFWERMYITYEIQFGYQNLFVSELGDFPGALTRQMFGLRFNAGTIPAQN